MNVGEPILEAEPFFHDVAADLPRCPDVRVPTYQGCNNPQRVALSG